MKILKFENEFFCKKVEYLKIRSLNFYIFYVYVLSQSDLFRREWNILAMRSFLRNVDFTLYY